MQSIRCGRGEGEFSFLLSNVAGWLDTGIAIAASRSGATGVLNCEVITDIAAMIQGGLGVAAGGNINPEGTSMFEPMGGSAPKYTGQNVINPLAAINAAGMMLDFLGEAKAGAAIEAAVVKIINTKIKSLAAGKMGHGTREVGDLVAAAV